jgi:chromosomal replication initiation ATPase DnaA
MSRAATTRTVGDQITALLTGFTLTTAARELVSRFVAAEQQPALPLLLDVLELEAQERHERRITRLRRASKLPPGKTFATLDEQRLPPTLVRRLHELADGDFLEDATNVLAFGLPGVGKSHAMCAVGHALVERGHPVLFMPTYSLVQELLAAKRVWSCHAPCANSISSPCSSSMTSAISSKAPTKPRFSSRSWPNATSAAPSSSRAI